MSTFIYILLFLFLLGLFTSKNKKVAVKQQEVKKDKPAPTVKKVKNSLYTVLKVPEDASSEEIKKSYRQLAKKYHPDHNSSKNAASQFRKITEAYDTLKDEDKRAAYDAVLKTLEEAEPQEEKVLCAAGSIQEMRGKLSESLKIPTAFIQFTHTGDIFVCKRYFACWRPVWQNGYRYHRRMVFHWEPIVELGFECYLPAIRKNKQYRRGQFQTIILTALDVENLKMLIGMCFNRKPESVILSDSGDVFVEGEYAWCWRLTADGYLEYYLPTDDDYDIWSSAAFNNKK